MPNYIVPSIESPLVDKLMKVLKNSIEPEMVPVKIESYAKVSNCFPNVAEKVKKDGEDICYGWVIWQSPNLIEAEMHAVWISPDNSLVDITPRDIDFESVLFIPDENFVYNGQFTDNVRLNITSNKLVDDFISICNALGDFYAKGERVSNTHLSLPEGISLVINGFEQLKAGYLRLLEQNGNISTVCFCGRSKAYKNCHGKDFQNELKKSVSQVNLLHKNIM
jgi:hypothetical protein